MKKTTLYLPEELKSSLGRLASAEGCSEAELIRRALHEMVERSARPRPKVPLTGRGLGNPHIASNVDDFLDGFGQ